MLGMPQAPHPSEEGDAQRGEAVSWLPPACL